MSNLKVNGSLEFNSLAGGGITALLDTIYPVGSIYMSVNSTSPADFIGGTWEQITNTFLLAAGSSYTAGSTGGSATRTLSTSNMPSHTHTFNADFYIRKAGSSANATMVAAGTNTTVTDSAYSSTWGNSVTYTSATHYPDKVAISGTSGSTGSGSSFSILPPYLAVYMWKRTA